MYDSSLVKPFFLGELKSHNLDNKSSGNLIHKKINVHKCPRFKTKYVHVLSCSLVFLFSKKYFNRKTMTLFSSFTSAYVLAFNFVLNFFFFPVIDVIDKEFVINKGLF